MKAKAGDSINGVTLRGYICTVGDEAYGPFKTADAAWKYAYGNHCFRENVLIQVLRDPFSEDQSQ